VGYQHEYTRNKQNKKTLNIFMKVKSEDLLSNLYVKRGANFHLKLICCKRILDDK
jgi:hypothetical protein